MLHIDSHRCPSATYSEVTLPPYADEPLGLALTALTASADENNAQSGARSNAQSNASVSSDAIFVMCDYRADGDSAPSEERYEGSEQASERHLSPRCPRTRRIQTVTDGYGRLRTANRPASGASPRDVLAHELPE